MATYYISGASDGWIKTNAKTLSGAKAIASKTYSASREGLIVVGEELEGFGIETVASKRDYDKWASAYSK